MPSSPRNGIQIGANSVATLTANIVAFNSRCGLSPLRAAAFASVVDEAMKPGGGEADVIGGCERVQLAALRGASASPANGKALSDAQGLQSIGH